MATKGHKNEAIKVEGLAASFQDFKDGLIGIPNTAEAVYYTQTEANAYNAELTGALNDTDPLTAEEAAAYNEAITGATKEAGDTLSESEANAYNATLQGAVTTSDIKTPAVPNKVKDYVDNGLSGKTDKVASATNGHLAGLDSNGNLTDSGKAASDFASSALVPSQATDQNQLADKAFVNSSIATATATYRGSYNLVSDLSLTVSATEQQVAAALASTISTADNNDYCYVQVPTADATPTEIARIDRYKHNGTSWGLEYTLNNSGFTAAEWAAINSNITSNLVTKLLALPTNSELSTLLNGKADASTAVTGVAYNTTSGKFTKTINGTTSDVVTLDSSPTANSKKPVTSGGVYAAIQAAMINPISDSSITAATTFASRDCVNVNGTMYLCDTATGDYPINTLVVQDGMLVTQDGAIVLQSPTASVNWHAI